MNTLKRFIHYYKPYQALFYLDLICAAVISMIDLLYPQILRSLTNTLFAGDPHLLLKALVPHWHRPLHYVYHSKPMQILCLLSGTYDGR